MSDEEHSLWESYLKVQICVGCLKLTLFFTVSRKQVCIFNKLQIYNTWFTSFINITINYFCLTISKLIISLTMLGIKLHEKKHIKKLRNNALPEGSDKLFFA